MEETVNKRIARNTLFLYLRLALATGISLYTSRVILQALGVTDYGLYGVVGGIVTMFSFLNTSMAGATSRFLTYELGQGDSVRLRETFATAFLLHGLIALFIVMLAETAGLWFLEYQLVIPPDRMQAARWVYQLSVLNMAIQVTQVPYNACIMAHEKIQFYAYMEIVVSILRLLVVYLLVIGTVDKLILYASLSLCIPVLLTIIYRYYCMRNFPESGLRFVWNPSIMKPMLRFSGWDIYGNISILARSQGVNMLLNIFFGPALNAAANIATHLQGVVVSFGLNLLAASRPQIIKQYARGNTHRMISLLRHTLRLNFLLLMVVIIPLLLEMDFILKVWLGEAPAYTDVLCACTLLFCIFSSMSSVVVSGVHATGHIKRPSLVNGTLYLAVIPVSYFLYRGGASPQSSYWFNVVAVFIGMLSNACTLRRHVPQFSMRVFLLKDLLPCLLVFAGVYAAGYVLRGQMAEGWPRMWLVGLSTTGLLLALGYWFLIPASMRGKIRETLHDKLCVK